MYIIDDKPQMNCRCQWLSLFLSSVSVTDYTQECLFAESSSFNMDEENYLRHLDAMGVALIWEREKKALMEKELLDDVAALQVKQIELSMLMENRGRMLADMEKTEKFMDGFMDFIGAIENNDVEKVQNFDEKSMMNDVVTLLNAGGFPGGNISPEIPLTPVGKENNVVGAEKEKNNNGN